MYVSWVCLWPGGGVGYDLKMRLCLAGGGFICDGIKWYMKKTVACPDHQGPVGMYLCTVYRVELSP